MLLPPYGRDREVSQPCPHASSLGAEPARQASVVQTDACVQMAESDTWECRARSRTGSRSVTLRQGMQPVDAGVTCQLCPGAKKRPENLCRARSGRPARGKSVSSRRPRRRPLARFSGQGTSVHTCAAIVAQAEEESAVGPILHRALCPVPNRTDRPLIRFKALRPHAR